MATFTPRRVLLVEDCPDHRDTLRILVQLWGHEVEVAADGRQGLEKGLAWRPQVGVLDLRLPRLDGYELARRLREALGDSVRLIALTAYGEEADRRRALRAGFDAHMTKPADTDELARLLTGG
jgi:CheY-like chemotaxis protein